MIFFIFIIFFSVVSISGENLRHQPTLNKSDIQKISDQTNKTPPKTDDGTNNKNATPITTKPVRIIFPTINLGLDVVDATINIAANIWPLSDTNAQYANFTPALGSKRGTMLIYGHNTLTVMQKTGDLQIGDNLIIIDEKNQTWNFTFVKKENVIPENVKFIYEDVPFRIVMFTCTGWNDQYRRLMYFDPI